MSEHIQHVMTYLPKAVSGSDQDYEDFVEATTKSACEVLCRPTMWEHKDGNPTGQWRYVGDHPQSQIEESKQ